MNFLTLFEIAQVIASRAVERRITVQTVTLQAHSNTFLMEFVMQLVLMELMKHQLQLVMVSSKLLW